MHPYVSVLFAAERAKELRALAAVEQLARDNRRQGARRGRGRLGVLPHRRRPAASGA